MSDQEYICYEVKLNRLFNFQAKENIVWFAIIFLFLLINISVSLFDKNFDAKSIILIICTCLIIMTVKLLCCPKCLDITPATIKFKYNRIVENLLTQGKISSHSPIEQSEYTLYNIKEIRYIQNSFEKIFSSGHIVIRGDVNVANSKFSRQEERAFTIYGIKDFQNTSDWMKAYVQISA